jgi:xanthine dehydrogenase molybdenum-binding subunit
VINKACEDLGLDPLQLRLQNACVTGYFGTTSCNIKDCMTQAAQQFGFTWKAFKDKTDTGVKRKGTAIVAGSHGCGGASPKQSAVISMNKDGTAQVQISAGECGMGVETVLAQIAADSMGLNLSDITVNYGTSEYPDSGSTGGSAATHNMGNAILAAAQDCKTQLFSVAAGILGVTADKLSSAKSLIFVTADPTKNTTFLAVMGKATSNIVGKGVGITFPVTTPSTHTQAYFAMCIEVEVDTETGEVTILRSNYAHDIGKVINPNTCNNQAVGGVIDSFGLTLSEEFVLDTQTGIPLTVNYLDYGLYSISNVPQLDVIWVEKPDPYGPFGAKGVAECSTVLSMCVIVSAVYNAIGKWIEPPVTPAKVLKALGKA